MTILVDLIILLSRYTECYFLIINPIVFSFHKARTQKFFPLAKNKSFLKSLEICIMKKKLLFNNCNYIKQYTQIQSLSTRNVSPTETTIYTLTAGNVEGSDTETVTIVVEPVKIIQPGHAEGKDTWVCSNYKNENNANYGSLLLGRETGSYSNGVIRSLLQFNLSSIPDNAIVADAELLLYQHNTYGSDDFSVGAHMITSPWDQYTVTWNNPVSLHPTTESIVTIIAGDVTWLSWNIKNLLQGWINGNINNYGVLLKKVNEGSGGTYITCWAADYTINPNLCPKLKISYYVP